MLSKLHNDPDSKSIGGWGRRCYLNLPPERAQSKCPVCVVQCGTNVWYRQCGTTQCVWYRRAMFGRLRHQKRTLSGRQIAGEGGRTHSYTAPVKKVREQKKNTLEENTILKSEASETKNRCQAELDVQ